MTGTLLPILGMGCQALIHDDLLHSLETEKTLEFFVQF